MARLTIQKAANMTGVSARTIRRRVKDGTIQAEKVLRGGRDVWVIAGGDLAAWAETAGHTMTTGGHEAAPVQDSDHDKQVDSDGQPRSTGPAQADTNRQEELDRARQRIQDLERERAWLRGHIDSLTRALPPAASQEAETEEKSRSWWQRLWGN